MLLKLKYSDTTRHRLAGALIRGSNPEFWLQEISRWGISSSELECYVMPESIQSVKPGGLFVCFTASIPSIDLVRQPYGRVGDRLFLPLNAVLHPEMQTEELRKAFLWERQVFHPVVGMVGFEASNRLNLVSLLNFPSSMGRDWSEAHSGLAKVPALDSIGLDRPAMEDFFQQKEEVGSKSPKEIPGGKEEATGSKTMRDLQNGALQGMKGILDALNNAFSGSGGGSGGGATYEPRTGSSAGTGGNSGGSGNAGGGGFSFGGGLFGRMQNWIDQRIEDLQEKRKSELERLMDLFESDPDAALKYAIPLGGDYWNRGTAAPSSSLGARSTNFNLGGLGGGRPVDGWNVDGYEDKLRERYLAAANKEIEAGDFRKAAYIHAHLLHDFTAAANVLEQGHFYREAAVLYKDHLKDPAAAADCLERGGLLLDAIELYVEMGKREKAADLYTTLKQKGKADILYQACADDATTKWDYLEAGRLYLTKMDRPEKAMEAYLEGWNKEAKPEECLVSYLDLYEGHGKSDLEIRLETMYRKETNANQRDTFFSVIKRKREEWEDEALLETVDEIAFEIISQQAANGNFQALNAIKTFVPDDQLIVGDVNRFIRDFRSMPASPVKPITFQLPVEAKWGHVVGLKDSLLAIGVGEEREICLARANWEGYVEMTRLPGTIGQAGDRLMVDAAAADLVFILTVGMQKIPVRVLGPGLKFKNVLKVISPPGYNWHTTAVGISDSRETTILDLEPNERRAIFHHYDALGNLKNGTVPSRGDGSQFSFVYPIADRQIRFFDSDMYLVSGLFVLSRESGSEHFRFDSFAEHLGVVRPLPSATCFPLPEVNLDGILEMKDLRHEVITTWKISPYAKKMTIAAVSDAGAFVLNDFTPGQKDLKLHFLLDAEFDPELIEFLPGMFLAVSGPGIVQIYDLMNEEPEFLVYFSVDHPIIAIMPTDLRCQFAVVLATGEVKLFEFDRY